MDRGYQPGDLPESRLGQDDQLVEPGVHRWVLELANSSRVLDPGQDVAEFVLEVDQHRSRAIMG
jgi:hypothetical protein